MKMFYFTQKVCFLTKHVKLFPLREPAAIKTKAKESKNLMKKVKQTNRTSL